MTKRGFGHIPDRPSLRTQQPALSHPLISARYAALKTAASALSLRAFEAPIYDQGQSGSCGGHGSAQLTFTALNAAGMPPPWAPSPKRIYQNTRAVRRAADSGSATTLPPLTDSGVMPADLATALARYGISQKSPATSPDGRNSDVWTAADTGGPDDVNDEATIEDLEAEGFTIITGEYRIDETAADLGAQIAASIAAKFPVGVGAFVDSGVMDWAAGDPPINSINLSDPQGGGHWYAITGYTYDGSSYVFIVANSWGAAYGDAGHFLITDAAIKQSASDIYPWAIARVASPRNAGSPK